MKSIASSKVKYMGAEGAVGAAKGNVASVTTAVGEGLDMGMAEDGREGLKRRQRYHNERVGLKMNKYKIKTDNQHANTDKPT